MCPGTKLDIHTLCVHHLGMVYYVKVAMHIDKPKEHIVYHTADTSWEARCVHRCCGMGYGNETVVQGVEVEQRKRLMTMTSHQQTVSPCKRSPDSQPGD